MTTFVKRAWYLAAWSSELGENLLARRIFDRPLVLFRTQEGQPRALEDRCPHRFAPLSCGTRQADGNLTCGYHGLTFDGAGRCVRNPFGPIPAGADVQHWAASERDGMIWIWGGEPATADNALIPDFSTVADNCSTRVVRGHTPLRAPYEFGIDNLMDLSHIEFVHKGSFAGAGVIFAGRHEVREEGDALHSNWWMPDVAAPSHTRGVYPTDMRCDHWLDMRWNAPASMRLQIGSTPAGQPRSAGIHADQAHILTPETATTTHYFWASARHLALESIEMDAMLTELFGRAFDTEDKPMIEAAYANLEGRDFWGAHPVSLGVDAGGLRVRRRPKALLSRESET